MLANQCINRAKAVLLHMKVCDDKRQLCTNHQVFDNILHHACIKLLMFPVDQIAKLLIIPCVCLIELFWWRKSFTTMELLSISIVTAGVAIV